MRKAKGLGFGLFFLIFPSLFLLIEIFDTFTTSSQKKQKNKNKKNKTKQKNTKKHANIDLSVFLSPTHIFSNLILKLIS